MSELHQKKLMSKNGLHRLLHPNIAGFSSRHWLDFLVHWQSSKSSDICARTFDTLKRYSVTELVKDREEKLAGLVKHLSCLLEWKRVCLVQPTLCSTHVALKVAMRTIDR